MHDWLGNLVILTIVLWTINGRRERKEIAGASCYCRPWNQYGRRPLTRLALHPLGTDLRLSVDMTTGHCVWRIAERNKKAAAGKEPSRGFPPLHCSWSADPSSCPTSQKENCNATVTKWSESCQHLPLELLSLFSMQQMVAILYCHRATSE